MLIFFVTSLLAGVKMKTGFAFGLFAIFSILRYRTESINVKEMTFLFISIIVAVINSLVTRKVPLFNILFANMAITSVVFLLERQLLKSYTNSVILLYEKIDLIHKGNKEELLEDIRNRTGLDVERYEIRKINFLQDTAEMTLFYSDKDLDTVEKEA